MRKCGDGEKSDLGIGEPVRRLKNDVQILEKHCRAEHHDKRVQRAGAVQLPKKMAKSEEQPGVQGTVEQKELQQTFDDQIE